MFLLYFFLFLTGLTLGSFITAVSYRIPNGINFVKGRSFCPKCKKKISWYDNIPLVSYFFLKGKCRSCNEKISLRYPIIELFSGLGFVFISSYALPDTIKTVYFLILFCLLLAILVIDLENQIIPDSLSYIFIIIVFLYTLIFSQDFLFTNLLSGFFASSFLLFLNLITKGKGMGLGDVKFAIAGGMFVGLKYMPVWLFSSFLTGALVGSILILFKKAGMKTKIAFGPFLVIGLFLTVIFGEKILELTRFL